jgi:hypothetical protein
MRLNRKHFVVERKERLQENDMNMTSQAEVSADQEGLT